MMMQLSGKHFDLELINGKRYDVTLESFFGEFIIFTDRYTEATIIVSQSSISVMVLINDKKEGDLK